jgi:hypothetical protein
MHLTISRRILVTAVVLTLAGGASAPAPLCAAPLALSGGSQGANGVDFLAQARLWWSAVWPWAEPGTKAVRRVPGPVKPELTCSADPNGTQHCTNATSPHETRAIVQTRPTPTRASSPQLTCTADPSGTQHCADTIRPQLTCTGDPNGAQHCTNAGKS